MADQSADPLHPDRLALINQCLWLAGGNQQLIPIGWCKLLVACDWLMGINSWFWLADAIYWFLVIGWCESTLWLADANQQLVLIGWCNLLVACDWLTLIMSWLWLAGVNQRSSLDWLNAHARLSVIGLGQSTIICEVRIKPSSDWLCSWGTPLIGWMRMADGWWLDDLFCFCCRSP